MGSLISEGTFQASDSFFFFPQIRLFVSYVLIFKGFFFFFLMCWAQILFHRALDEQYKFW